MPTIFARVKDQGNGAPIKNAYVHGQYHWGAIFGQGTNAFAGKTGEDGQFPITVSGGLGDMQADFNYSVEAAGYLATDAQQHVGGITGDYGLNPVYLNKASTGSPLGGPGDKPTTFFDDIGRQGQGGGNFLASLGLPAAALLIILIIGSVIALVALAFILR